MGGLVLLAELLVASNNLVMLPPDLAGCRRLTIVDISQNAITGAAIPPGLLQDTNLARLWRDGCPIEEADLSALPGYSAFKAREEQRIKRECQKRPGLQPHQSLRRPGNPKKPERGIGKRPETGGGDSLFGCSRHQIDPVMVDLQRQERRDR